MCSPGLFHNPEVIKAFENGARGGTGAPQSGVSARSCKLRYAFMGKFSPRTILLKPDLYDLIERTVLAAVERYLRIGAFLAADVDNHVTVMYSAV